MIDLIDHLMSWLTPILGGLATAWALTTFTSLPKWSILLLTLPGLFAGQAAVFLSLALLTRLTRNPRPTHQLPATDRPAHPHPKTTLEPSETNYLTSADFYLDRPPPPGYPTPSPPSRGDGAELSPIFDKWIAAIARGEGDPPASSPPLLLPPLPLRLGVHSSSSDG